MVDTTIRFLKKNGSYSSKVTTKTQKSVIFMEKADHRQNGISSVYKGFQDSYYHLSILEYRKVVITPLIQFHIDPIGSLTVDNISSVSHI